MSDPTTGLDPVDVRRRTAGAASSLVRLWWVPLLIGALVAVGVGASTRAVTTSTSTAIVNTRAASQLPNERIDLVKDLSAVMNLSPVLEPVADANDMTVAELRESSSVDQVQSSSLARITVTSDKGAEFRESLIEQLLTSGKSYLTPPSPPPALSLALNGQSKAIDAYYDAIEKNGGLTPRDTLKRLQDRLLVAENDKNKVLRAALLKQLPRAIKKARNFDKISRKVDQANSDLNAISASSKNNIWGGPSALELNFEADSEAGLTNALPLRRGLAAGLAAALIAAGFILLASLARRRER